MEAFQGQRTIPIPAIVQNERREADCIKIFDGNEQQYSEKVMLF